MEGKIRDLSQLMLVFERVRAAAVAIAVSTAIAYTTTARHKER